MQNIFKGSVQDSFSVFSVDKSANCDLVNKALLKAYKLVLEAHLQKFRFIVERDKHTYSEF